MSRHLPLLVPITILTVAVGALVAVSSGSEAGASVATNVATADAFIASDLPTTVQNTQWLSMDASPRRDAYFKFDVVVPAGERVSSVMFRCYAGSSSSSGASLWTTSSGWSETSLTWAGAPSPDFSLPPAGSTGAVTSGTYATADVTSALTASGTVTLVSRTTSATQWSCASKENTSNHPAELVVTTAAIGTPTASTPVSSPPTTTPTTTPTQPPAVTNTYNTTADAFTASDRPTSVQNTTWVSMDAKPLRYGYFKFAVVVPTGQHVTAAQFRCYAGSAAKAGASLWPAGSGWSETSLTWATAPLPNFALPALGTTAAVPAGTYATANVTAAVTGGGAVTLVTRTATPTQWSCASKENSVARPAQLVVTTTGDSVTTPPVTTPPVTTPPVTTPPVTTPPVTTPPVTTPPPSGTILVAGIGDGGPDAAHWTASLAAAIRADRPAAFLWSGDVRMTGTPAEWQLYNAIYGPLKSVTLPTPGNHDWTNVVTGYNAEFGSGAPYADTLTYCNAVNLANGWSLFSINSYTQASCMSKFTAFLAAPGNRKIVITHVPRYSGGSGHGSNTGQATIWNAMKGHAFALFSGHDHDSQVIEADGMVQLVNGCGGASYYGVTPVAGTVYYSTGAADCTYDRLLLDSGTVTVQAVHADGSIDFAKTYPVVS